VSVSVAFDKARADGRAALVGYLPAGFPTVAGGIEAVRAMATAGVDLVEIGYPYSDPVMDGPVIQRASEIALERGVRGADVLRTVAAVAETGVPVVVMLYWNLVEHYRGGGTERGVRTFARDLVNAGGSGLITPDLIPDEADDWLAASDEFGLDRIFLVAPSSTDARLAKTVASCRGFVYATSVMGVTGARDVTSSAAPTLVSRVRQAIASGTFTASGAPEATALPVGVGLGVRDGDQAAEVGAFADGVIVGSALVNCLLDAPSTEAGLDSLRTLTAELADGVRRSVRAAI
jgi:tryptophan synthase alpha chain